MRHVTLNVILDPRFALESDILALYDAGELDAKGLLVIGFQAVKASTTQLHNQTVAAQLDALKNSYEELLRKVQQEFQLRVTDKTNEMNKVRSILQSTYEHSRNDYIGRIRTLEESLVELKSHYTNVLQDATSVVERSFCVKLSEKENEIRMLRDRLDRDISVAVQDKETEIRVLREKLDAMQNAKYLQRDTQLAVLEEKVEVLQSSKEVLLDELKASREQAKTLQYEFMNALRNEEIAALKKQLAAVRGSNFSKGVVGENFVRHILQRSFPDMEANDKSGASAESDLHLIRHGDNRFLAVECKNKGMITLQDVDKSLRDIVFLKQKYGDMFAGYIFVSLKSVNIPKKGTTFEIQNGDIPVAWVGYDADLEGTNDVIHDTLPLLIKLVWKTGDVLRDIIGNSKLTTQVEDQLMKFRESIGYVLRDSLSKFEQNAKAICNLQTSVKILNDNNTSLLTSFASYIDLHSLHSIGNASDNTMTDDLKCSTCGKMYKRRADYIKHIGICKS